MSGPDLAGAIESAGTLTLAGGRTIHRMGFGTLQLCGPNGWGPPRDPDTAVALLRHAVDAGVDFIDTADAYGPVVAEDLVAAALYPYPDQLLIATKGGQVRPGPDRWVPLGRPEYLRQCVELSLRRLRLERIELYQLHRIDPTVPVEDQFGVLQELRDEGKIVSIGLSEVTLDEFVQVSELVEVASVQNLYNLSHRAHEAVLDACTERAIPFVPWYPLMTGGLAEGGGPLADVAARHGVTPAQVSLAWILHRAPNTVLIPGTSSPAHLDENLLAGAISLTAEDLTALDGVEGTIDLGW